MVKDNYNKYFKYLLKTLHNYFGKENVWYHNYKEPDECYIQARNKKRLIVITIIHYYDGTCEILVKGRHKIKINA